MCLTADLSTRREKKSAFCYAIIGERFVQIIQRFGAKYEIKAIRISAGPFEDPIPQHLNSVGQRHTNDNCFAVAVRQTYININGSNGGQNCRPDNCGPSAGLKTTGDLVSVQFGQTGRVLTALPIIEALDPQIVDHVFDRTGRLSNSSQTRLSSIEWTLLSGTRRLEIVCYTGSTVEMFAFQLNRIFGYIQTNRTLELFGHRFGEQLIAI